MQESVTCTCTKCSHDFQVNARLLGRELMCPNCGESVVVEDRSEKLAAFPQPLLEVIPFGEVATSLPTSGSLAAADLSDLPTPGGGLETVESEPEVNGAKASIIGGAVAEFSNVNSINSVLTVDTQEQGRSVPSELIKATEPVANDKIDSVERRRRVAGNLISLLPFVAPQHKDKNSTLFYTASHSDAPPSDRLWADLAFTASVYGPVMSDKPLSQEQRLALIEAIAWASWHFQSTGNKLGPTTFLRLCSFLDSCVEKFDASALSRVVDCLAPIVNQTEARLLRNLERVLAKWPGHREKVPFDLSSGGGATQNDRLTGGLGTSLETTRAADEKDVASVIDAISRNFQFFDKKYADTNIQTLSEVRMNPDAVEVTDQLATLSHLLARGALFRHRNGAPLIDHQIESCIFVAKFAATHGHGIFQAESELNCILLETILALQSDLTDPNTFLHRIEQVLATEEMQKILKRHPYWDDVLALLNAHLSGLSSAGHRNKEQANGCIRAIADRLDKTTWNRDFLNRFVDEVNKHDVGERIELDRILRQLGREAQPPQDIGPLSFLKPAVQAEFRTSLKNSELKKIKTTLVENRRELFRSTSRALVHPSFQDIQPPSRFVNLAHKTWNRFKIAREQILGADVSKHAAACSIFEELSSEYSFPQARVYFREWFAYARAVVGGPHRGVGDWEEIHKDAATSKDGASFEAAWNLAVFNLKLGDPQKALETLIPGVLSLMAPFSHLRFALYCGVQLLEEKHEHLRDVSPPLLDFLVHNLCKLPIAQCYLCWLCLSDYISDGNLIEQSRVLATFQDLEEKPIELIQPNSIYPNQSGMEKIDKFRQYLLSKDEFLDTWRIWVNEFAQRYRRRTGGWIWLAEACEKAKDTQAAEEALKRCVDEQLEFLERAERAKRRGDDGRESAPVNERGMRYAMTLLFELYKRHAFPAARVKQTFETYYKNPGTKILWDAQNALNTKLIGLIRQHIPDDGANKIPGDGTTVPGALVLSPNLFQEISEVIDVPSLQHLRSRIDAALAGISGDSVVRSRKDLVKTVVTETSSLLSLSKGAGELEAFLVELNKKIKRTLELLEKEPTLRQLKPLVSASRRAFENFSLNTKGWPALQITRYEDSAGVASDFQDTSLIVSVVNPGPGEIEDAHLSAQSHDGTIQPRGQAVVVRLGPKQSEVVGIPIKANLSSSAIADCLVEANYEWGVIKGLKATNSMTLSRFSFSEFVRAHGIGGFEFPNPFVYDRALDQSKHDPRLFKGRTNHLELIRNTLLKGRPPGSPIYFYGIRRCGKSSLLNRIAGELAQAGLMPISFDLHGMRADEQDLNEIVYNLVNKKIVGALQSNEGWKNESIISELQLSQDHKYPLSELETIFKKIKEGADGRQPVFLIDEFQLIASPKTSLLLDLLRRVYELDYAWFIFSGLLRPILLQEACGSTGLLPLQNREVDFLEKEEVAGTVCDPISECGIKVPESTIDALYAYTAGNPNFVGKMAHMALYRLNDEGRNVITPQDVADIGAKLSDDKANFSSTVLSRQLLSDEEINAAKQIAAATPDREGFIGKEVAYKLVGEEVLQRLTDKSLFRLRDGRIEPRGLLLLDHLKKLTEFAPSRPIVTDGRKRVGLFIDIENILEHAPGSNLTEFGRKLIEHCERYGQLLTKQAFADRRNMPSAGLSKIQLESADIEVNWVPDAYRPKKNLADELLMQKLDDEIDHWDLGVVVLVLGDEDYGFRITALLNRGIAVRLVGAEFSRHVAERYRLLLEERRQYCLSEGRDTSDFFMDGLELILKDANPRSALPQV